MQRYFLGFKINFGKQAFAYLGYKFKSETEFGVVNLEFRNEDYVLPVGIIFMNDCPIEETELDSFLARVSENALLITATRF